MKIKYQKPSIKVKEIETESPLAVSMGGNTGITTPSDGDRPPGSASSKRRNIFGLYEEPPRSTSIWEH